MELLDIACIIFACVTANHLGLIKAAEDLSGYRLYVVNCPKCLTFWSVMLYGCCDDVHTAPLMVLAISFLSSYLALWLELAEGYLDLIYMKAYEKIITRDLDDTVAPDSQRGDSTGTMS